MSTFKSYFDDTYFQGINLSAEARTLAQDAAQAMQNWIDQSVDELSKNVLQKQTELIKTLAEDRDAGVKALEESRKNLADITQELQKLQQAAAKVANNDALVNQAGQLSVLTAKAEQALKEQAEAMKKRGEKVIEVAGEVAKKFVTSGVV